MSFYPYVSQNTKRHPNGSYGSTDSLRAWQGGVTHWQLQVVATGVSVGGGGGLMLSVDLQHIGVLSAVSCVCASDHFILPQ